MAFALSYKLAEDARDDAGGEVEGEVWEEI
jgi:hypothetical protein